MVVRLATDLADVGLNPVVLIMLQFSKKQDIANWSQVNNILIQTPVKARGLT